MSKKSRFREPFYKQHGKGDQTLLKPEPHHLYHIYWWLLGHWWLKKSLKLICKILALFVKILNAGYKYPLLNRDNLKKTNQMQLSQKQNLFSQFLSKNLKSKLNFENFETNDDPHGWCVCEITDSEKCV